jgi:hypothetical protein
MDTAIPSIPSSDLFARLGSPRWPVVLGWNPGAMR